jgi:hypothetical protein
MACSKPTRARGRVSAPTIALRRNGARPRRPGRRRAHRSAGARHLRGVPSSANDIAAGAPRFRSRTANAGRSRSRLVRDDLAEPRASTSPCGQRPRRRAAHRMPTPPQCCTHCARTGARPSCCSSLPSGSRCSARWPSTQSRGVAGWRSRSCPLSFRCSSSPSCSHAYWHSWSGCRSCCFLGFDPRRSTRRVQ